MDLISARLNNLEKEIYKKNKLGKYWFETISDEDFEKKKNAWSTMISNSMASYYTILKEEGNGDENIEENSEFINYITSASFFLVNKVLTR
tara:strand:- start:1713 stop:1985 length:273 start_codon:yes stop_codon:yes gene_type:complete